MKISAIIPAAGSGTRFDTEKNKLFQEIDGIPVIIHTLKVISSVDEISEIIICTSTDLILEIENLAALHAIPKIKKIISGGKSRQESVFIGLKALDGEEKSDLALIHDGARPLVSQEIIKNTIKIAKEKGAAIAAIPVKNTIKRVNNQTSKVIETLNREELWNIQTPQVFEYEKILQAHVKLKNENFTDDSAMMEKLGYAVFVVLGSYKNIKITTKEDMAIAKILIHSGKF